MTNFKIVIQVIKDFKLEEAQESDDLHMSFGEAPRDLTGSSYRKTSESEEDQKRMDSLFTDMTGGDRRDTGKSYMVSKRN
jgi:hypothetical protein